MKTRDETYKNLQYRVGADAYYQFRVVKGGSTYLTDKIVSCTIQQMLCQGGVGVEIGQACASVCNLVLLEASSNWERMAKFTVSFRIVSANATTYTDWIDLGQYYTDTRSEDTYGQLTITAYDSMLLMEKTWTDSIPSEDLPANWPITARAWATLIQQNTLAIFENLTQLDDTIAFVGLDTTSSIRDVLKNIAVVHGGNWTVLADGRLKLIQYQNLVDAYPEQTDNYIDLGQAEETIETSPPLPPVTGVHLETEAGTQMQYGGDSGYMVRAICNVATTSGIPELCLSKVNQFVYKPFQAFNVCIDPAIELGDSIKINGVGYQVMALDLLLQGLITATISAPYDQEVDHEYAIPNEDAKTYRKAMSAVEEGMSGYVPRDEFESSLVQTEQSIQATVAATYVNQNVYNEQIAEIQSQLDGNIQTWSGNVVPTLSNAPASDWTTATQKAEHVGDLYFINSDAGIPEAGNYYRFENNDGTYSWTLLTDSAMTEALNKAAAAQAAAEAAQDSADAAQSTANTANSTAQLKGRIFVVQPTPPYDKGDLWFNSTSSDIMVCMRDGGRQSGSFVASDWQKRDKYTDDSALTNFINNVYTVALNSIQDQIDQKAETYYQDSDPALTWGAAIAGIAIAGVDKIGIWNSGEHEGDLWFRTTDNTTWYFDGSNWVQQSVPDEVFDQIDGKAQIFVGQPYPPYHVGDLWFNGTESDIKTCTTQRLSGSFVSGDWVKYNKYTDDTKAKEVEQALTQFKTTFSVNPEDIKAEVEKRVIANKTETVNSFGWKLTDTGHIWYANNNEVMRVSQSGAYIKGEIRATTGYIGNDSNGFAIGATNIRNGMTELADTSHDGIYIGTDGIALGKGKFKVTKAGVITASSGTIGGFTITASSMYTNGQSSYSGTGNGIYMGSSGFRIGSKFKVDNAGNVTCGNITATSGTFEGSVYAKNIQYGGSAGTLSGASITSGTLDGTSIVKGSISGGTNGQIAQQSIGSLDIASNSISGGSGGHIKSNTLTDLNVVSSGYSPSALNSTIQGQLTSAGIFGNAIKENSTYPTYFAARKIQALTAFYSGGYNVYGDGGSVAYDLAGHYHQISVDANGNVQLGTPQKAKPDPFNIADTQKYKTDVLASRAVLYCNATNYSNFSSGYDCDVTGSSYHYRPSGASYEYARVDLRNSYGNTLKTLRIKMPPQADDVSVTLSDNGVTWNNSYKLYYYGASASATDGVTSDSQSFSQYFNPTEAIEFGKSQAAGYTNIYWGADLTRWDQSGGDITGVNIRVYVYGTKDGYNQQITYGDKYFSRY